MNFLILLQIGKLSEIPRKDSVVKSSSEIPNIPSPWDTDFAPLIHEVICIPAIIGRWHRDSEPTTRTEKEGCKSL